MNQAVYRLGLKALEILVGELEETPATETLVNGILNMIDRFERAEQSERPKIASNALADLEKRLAVLENRWEMQKLARA